MDSSLLLLCEDRIIIVSTHQFRQPRHRSTLSRGSHSDGGSFGHSASAASPLAALWASALRPAAPPPPLPVVPLHPHHVRRRSHNGGGQSSSPAAPCPHLKPTVCETTRVTCTRFAAWVASDSQVNGGADVRICVYGGCGDKLSGKFLASAWVFLVRHEPDACHPHAKTIPDAVKILLLLLLCQLSSSPALLTVFFSSVHEDMNILAPPIS